MPYGEYLRGTTTDFQQLIRTGRQNILSPDSRRAPFPGLSYSTNHPKKEYRRGDAVIADMHIIHRIPRVYVADAPELSRFTNNLQVITPDDFIRFQRTEGGIVIGFSGFASKGFQYTEQARLIYTIFGEIQRPIDLVVTGGTRDGDVALANEIATAHGIARMAFTPKIGLHSLVETPEGIPPVDYLCITGDNFGDETKSIGTKPDILFLIGGGDNSWKEVNAALERHNLLISQGRKGNRIAVIDFVDNPKGSPTEEFGRLAVKGQLPDGVSYLNTMDDLKRFLVTV